MERETAWLFAIGAAAAGLILISRQSGPALYAPRSDAPGEGAGGLVKLRPGQLPPSDAIAGPPDPVLPPRTTSSAPPSSGMVAVRAAAGSAPTPPAPRSSTVILPITSSLSSAAYAAARAGKTPVVIIPGLGPYVVSTPGGPPGGATVPQIQSLNQTINKIDAGVRAAAAAQAQLAATAARAPIGAGNISTRSFYKAPPPPAAARPGVVRAFGTAGGPRLLA